MAIDRMGHQQSPGFTLLEILLVVLIVAIMTAAGANLINSQSIERVIMNQARQVESNLAFLCEKAVLENHAFGIEWSANDYHVLRYQEPEWVVLEAQQNTDIPEAIQVEIRLDGFPQNTADEIERLPHIVCQSDGSFNAFELRFADASQVSTQDDYAYYRLSTESPWQMTGGWYQP